MEKRDDDIVSYQFTHNRDKDDFWREFIVY
jgi:hypothetical protein